MRQAAEVSTSPGVSVSARRGRIPAPILWLFAIDLGLVLANQANEHLFGRWGVLNALLDLNSEGSISNWYSTVQLFLVGLFLAVLVGSLPGRLDKLRMACAAALFVFLSKEECGGFHDHLRNHLVASRATASSEPLFAFTTGWMLWLAPPLVGAMLVLGWRTWGILKGRGVIGRYITAGILFIGSSVGMEVLWNYSVFWGAFGIAGPILCEELGEMVAGTIFLWATWDLLGSYGVRLVRGEPGEPRSILRGHLRRDLGDAATVATGEPRAGR